MRGEFRERVEGFDELGFVERPRRPLLPDRRFRFNATVDAQRDSSRHRPGAGRARRRQDASAPTGAPFKAPFDLRQAVRGRRRRQELRSAARLGRQELVFGDQRLVGHVELAQRGAHVRRAHESPSVEGGADRRLRRVRRSHPRRRVRQERQRQPLRRRLCDAAAGSCRRATVEPYVFWRRDINQRGETGALGTLQQVTTGVAAGRASCRRGSTTTSRWRSARLARTAIRSARGRGTGRSARRCLAASRRTLTGEYNYASGDADPADGDPRHVRSALPDRARQVRPGRPGRLAEHPPRPRRLRFRAAQGDADHRELSLVLAGGEARRAVRGERRAAGARRRRAPPARTSVRRSICRWRVP